MGEKVPYASFVRTEGSVRIDKPVQIWHNLVPMRYLSTEGVAREVGIGRRTLERWLTRGELKPPSTFRVGQGTFRHWTAADVQRVRKYKQQNYRKGRGRKKTGMGGRK